MTAPSFPPFLVTSDLDASGKRIDRIFVRDLRRPSAARYVEASEVTFHPLVRMVAGTSLKAITHSSGILRPVRLILETHAEYAYLAARPYPHDFGFLSREGKNWLLSGPEAKPGVGDGLAALAAERQLAAKSRKAGT